MIYNWAMDKCNIIDKNKLHRGRVILILTVFLALISILSGCSLFPQEDEVLAPPLVKPKREDYQIYAVKRNTIINKIQVTGHFVSAIDYSLSFEKGGRLNSITVKNGDKVTKGQEVARIDTGDLENQIELAGIAVKRAEIVLNEARDALNTAKLLQEIQDRAVNAPDIRRAQYNVQRAELDLEAVRINLNIMEKNLQSARLVSPVDGIVIFVDIKLKKGDIIEPYKTIVQVADPKALQIMFDARTLNNPGILKPGMDAELTFGTKKMKGKVVMSPYSMPEDMDEKNKDAVILEAENLPEEIEMGDSIDISIILEKKENVLTIPLEGLRSYMGRNYVYLLDGNSKKEANVEIGTKSATEVEIISGLKEGQQVILR